MAERTRRLTVRLQGSNDRADLMHIWSSAGTVFSAYTWLALVSTEDGALFCGQLGAKRVATKGACEALQSALGTTHRVVLLPSLSDNDVKRKLWTMSRGHFSQAGGNRQQKQVAALTADGSASRHESTEIVASIISDLFYGADGIPDRIDEFMSIRDNNQKRFEQYMAHVGEAPHACTEDCIKAFESTNEELHSAGLELDCSEGSALWEGHIGAFMTGGDVWKMYFEW